MIIAISGKIGSGKDTIAKIVQWLMYENYFSHPSKAIPFKPDMVIPYIPNQFQNKKFAGKLKDIVCLLIGCTREELENPDFKNTKLGKEWTRYAYAIGSGTKDGQRTMWDMTCTKEKYEEEYRINWQTAYKQDMTPRWLLQLLGTEAARDVVHRNVWVNALFADYIPTLISGSREEGDKTIYPNWIITDCRFPNEAQAVKDRGGIVIRVNRYDITGQGKLSNEHDSETALDDYDYFDYVIDNFGTIEELIEKVKNVLINEKII